MNRVKKKFMKALSLIKFAAEAVVRGEDVGAEMEASPRNGRAILTQLGEVEMLPELLQAGEDVYDCLKNGDSQDGLVQAVIRYSEARSAFLGTD